METTISNFHRSFSIPEIQKLAFHITHVKILGTNHCGDSLRTAFKRCKSFQDVLCRREYAERVVGSFDNQIQSEYYGGNRSVSIECIVLEHFSALPQTDINSSTKPCPRHAVFHSFLSDDSKQYADTTTSHNNRLIELFKKKLMSALRTIWGKTDGCAEQYRCGTELYLMSVLSQCHSTIFDRGISAPGHGKEEVHGLNAIGKRYMY